MIKSQSDGNMAEMPIIANDHPHHLLEATLLDENAENAAQNNKYCAVECHSKRVTYFTA